MQTEARKAYLRENMKRLRSNPEYRAKEALQKKKWYLKNHDKELQRCREYHASHKVDCKRNHDDWVNTNREALKLYRRQYRVKMSPQAKAKLNNWQKEYIKKKRRENVGFHLYSVIQGSITKSLKCRNSTKSFRTVQLLGCSIQELKYHLEKGFHLNSRTGEAMTWENYGKFGWHIDHIIPIASFTDLSDPEQQKICFHYTNLQPLWWWENLEKGDKY